jgi:phage replication O-like protein O
MASPQKENGYTAIANEILEELVKADLLSSELRIILFILRKTYGYQKKQDIISLSQFSKGCSLSRPTIVKSIKNLVIKNLLVKTALPPSKISFSFNKDYEKWVVKTAKLVKGKSFASKYGLTKTSKDGLTHKRKKEIYTKERDAEQSSENTGAVINLFKDINPSYKILFPRKPQHDSAQRLLEREGFEKLQKVIQFISNRMSDKFCPQISTPIQLEEKWSALGKYAIGLKKSQTINNQPNWKVWN